MDVGVGLSSARLPCSLRRYSFPAPTFILSRTSAGQRRGGEGGGVIRNVRSSRSGRFGRSSPHQSGSDAGKPPASGLAALRPAHAGGFLEGRPLSRRVGRTPRARKGPGDRGLPPAGHCEREGGSDLPPAL